MAGWPLLGVDTPFDPTYKLVTSHFISPKSLAVLRLTAATYALLTLLVDIIYQAVVLHSVKSYVAFLHPISPQCKTD